VLVLCVGASLRPANPSPVEFTIRPDTLRADGYDTAELSIASGESMPAVSVVDNLHSVSLSGAERTGGRWLVQVRAGIMPGRVRLRIEAAGHRVAVAELVTTPDSADSVGDGTPDFLRLDENADQTAFRQWFTWLAEAQYFQPPAARPAEITDCAALLRYAYREALHGHDSAWANSMRLPLMPAFDSVAKYQYPFTPLGAALFKTRDGAFLQFADAQTLWRFNSHIVSRDVARALPGDLLFFKQDSDHPTFHAMIYIGKSQLRPDGDRYVLYHTGPTGPDPGEIRRLTVDELMRFPQPEWRPIPANTSFLGVARWNILR
jgi:uncharacterized protein